MQKKIPAIILTLAVTFISASLYSQSTIVIDNADTKPVPVKMMNPPGASSVKIPFTQYSEIVPGGNTVILVVKGPVTADSIKVIEYVMATGFQVSQFEMTLTLANNPRNPPPLTRKYVFSVPAGNIYSANTIIVLRNGDSVSFSNNGTAPKDMFASGYMIKL